MNRSLNMEQEARERENDSESSKSNRSSSNEASKLPVSGCYLNLIYFCVGVVKGSLVLVR